MGPSALGGATRKTEWLRGLLFRFGRKVQSAAIRAVAQAGRGRAIGKDMAQMAAAFGAMELGTGHAVIGVGGGLHRPRQGVEKTGPAGAAVELRRGVEQFGRRLGKAPRRRRCRIRPFQG